MAKFFGAWALACILATAGAESARARTLEDVRSVGVVTCGLNADLPGLSVRRADYTWSGMAVDLCRALAAAVLGDPSRTNFVALAEDEQTAALQSGEIDVLFPALPVIGAEDAANGLMAVTPYLYEGISLLAPAPEASASGVEEGATICLLAGAGHASLVRARVSAAGGKPVDVASEEELQAIVQAGGCGRMAGLQFSLARLKAQLAGNPMQLVEGRFGLMAHQPLIRQGDDQWFHVVREAEYALIRAAEQGLTQEKAQAGDVQRLAKAPHLLSAGLPEGWQLRMTAATGNLTEIFERNYGNGTGFALPPGVNAPWNRGGLFIAPP